MTSTSEWRDVLERVKADHGRVDGLVNNAAVHPGAIATEMLFDHGEEAVSRLTSAVPLGRVGRPEEVGAVVLFLLSDESSYVNGAEILVDGGVITR